MIERTLVLIKPDGVSRGLIGEIIKRIENKGLKIIGLKMMYFNRKLAEDFYYMHRNKPFFEDLISHITSGPVVAIVVEGNFAITTIRRMVGATSPHEAAPGTIRGDYGLNITLNVVHASDNVENSLREIKLLFENNEIISNTR
ncbi:MAG: nucleoside-diphosphate kinase [Candidatus Methanomethylicia archaeon]|nr:nucleoside-diphosphate kinase [Candidatus Methanomethylicia archaeon]MCX8169066.1 nucleoside-diphosphate kinase [Candidatus Methanomethylicia archaeon]MDW7988798.1 nucleoside-diphosphate kinase [Nitrososphaerota archaeon]